MKSHENLTWAKNPTFLIDIDNIEGIKAVEFERGAFNILA